MISIPLHLFNRYQNLLELSDDELDKALRLAKEENGILKPTVTGMLLIGREDRIADLLPTSKEYFQVLEGTEAVGELVM